MLSGRCCFGAFLVQIRRVLVTDASGRESVVEVKDDLGVRADDTAEITRRLASQGIRAAKVTLHSGGEDGIQDSPAKKRGNPTFASSIKFG